MAIDIARGKTDEGLDQVISALKAYEVGHAQAQMDLYRQNLVSIRIRIVDPSFHGQSKSERHARIWKYLGQLPEPVQGDISMLLLLTPDEKAMSFANFEFDDPIPSGL